MSKSQVLGCLWGVVRGNHYAGVMALNFGADPLNFNGPLLCRMKSGGRDTTKKGVPGSSWQFPGPAGDVSCRPDSHSRAWTLPSLCTDPACSLARVATLAELEQEPLPYGRAISSRENDTGATIPHAAWTVRVRLVSSVGVRVSLSAGSLLLRFGTQ